jgi:hypothetical protein
MRRFRGAWLPGVRCALVALGLLSTSCIGVIGLGAATLVAGAGVLAFTCYDRVSVTVTDRQTGTPLCDAKVTFIEGKSSMEATSCYEAALAPGSYTLRVERHGLETYEEPVEVTRGGTCGQSTQTIYVALDRLHHGQETPPGGEPPPAPLTAMPVVAPSAVVPPASASTPAPAPSSAPQASTSAPPTPPAPPAAAPTPAPSATAFPSTP